MRQKNFHSGATHDSEISPIGSVPKHQPPGDRPAADVLGQSLVLFAIATQTFCCAQSWAERMPDSPKEATHVVTGTVQAVFSRETSEQVQYIVQIKVGTSEYPETAKHGDVLQVYCYQRREPSDPLQKLLSRIGEGGHTAVPKEGQHIRVLAKPRHGILQGLYPDWFTVIKPKSKTGNDIGKAKK